MFGIFTLLPIKGEGPTLLYMVLVRRVANQRLFYQVP